MPRQLTKQRKVWAWATPDAAVTPDQAAGLGRDLATAGADYDAAEEIMVAAIRASASRHSEIGQDCMSVLMSPYLAGPNFRVRYIPRIDQSPAPDGENDVPSAFAPWFVTPNALVPPAVLDGPALWHFGGVEVDVQAPEAAGQPFHRGMSTQGRPPAPGWRQTIWGPRGSSQ